MSKRTWFVGAMVLALSFVCACGPSKEETRAEEESQEFSVLEEEHAALTVIRDELNAIRETQCQVLHEKISCVGIASADMPARYKLGVGADRRPHPNIATPPTPLVAWNVALFGPDERPDFVGL